MEAPDKLDDFDPHAPTQKEEALEGGEDDDEPHRHGRKRDTDDPKEEKEDQEEYADEGATPWFVIANRYPKASFWFYIVLGFAAMRAATTFIIVVSFLTLPVRGLQLVGIFIPKVGKHPIGKYVSMVGYGLSTFFNFLIIGACLVKG